MDETAFWREVAYVAAREPAGAVVSAVLGLLGRCTHVDRAWIIRYNDQLSHFWTTHEWSAASIVSHMQDVQSVPLEIMGDVLSALNSGQQVFVPSVRTMSSGTPQLKEELLRQNIQSIAMIPLCLRRKPIGNFGFDMVKHPTDWRFLDREFLKRVAKFLVGLMGAEQKVEAPQPEVAPPLQPPSRLVALLQGRTLVNVDMDDLLYIETYGDYTWVNLRDGERHMERKSLRAWESILPPEEFIRIHQRFLVRVDQVGGLKKDAQKGWLLALKGCKELLPVGRTYRHLVRQRMAF